MKTVIWLAATQSGISRMSKRAPLLAREEVGVRLTITIPDEVFRPWSVAAEVTVAKGSVLQPVVDVVVGEPEAPE